MPQTPSAVEVTPHPRPGHPPFVRIKDIDINCYATVTLDAPWGKTRTLGLWLQELN